MKINVKRNLILFKNLKDLNNAVKKLLIKIPYNIDLVVGIPRSGLLVASLISLYRNIPLTDIDGLINMRLIKTGKRLNYDSKSLFSRKLNILIVDDSISSGKQINKVKEQIQCFAIQSNYNIKYAVLYAISENANMVDYYYEITSPIRIFEWNVLNHTILKTSCIDIDGVLCRDPDDIENDDGEKYLKFIKEVNPNFVPKEELGYLITCRLEKYRMSTEEWLEKWSFKYKKLIMMDYKTKIERQKENKYAFYKATKYLETNAQLFIESNEEQAKKIAKISRKQVLCFETMEMLYYPSFLIRFRVYISKLLVPHSLLYLNLIRAIFIFKKFLSKQ